jgi:hypothetical protein
MTCEVLHAIAPLPEGAKTAFVSFRGEVTSQFKINKTLIEEGAVSPAAFSLSVFNTAVAEASIALGLTGGYTALYPARFGDAFATVAAMLAVGGAPAVALVYADEAAPVEYAALTNDPPFAFAALLVPGGAGVPAEHIASPADFLRYCITSA